MDEDNYVEANEPLMREEQLNRIHDPALTAEVEAAWRKSGVDSFVAEGLKFYHFVRKSAHMHVKSGNLVIRLRAERNAARAELGAAKKALHEKEKNLAVLKKFSGEVQQNLERSEKEKAEEL